MAITSNIDILKDKKILQYPLGLGSSEKDVYGQDQQYFLIKINTDEKSTKLKGDSSLGQATVTNSRTGVGVGTLNSKTTAAKNADPDLRLKFGDAAVEKEQFRIQKGMVRLDKVIVLPMPAELSISTNVSYSDDYNPTLLTKLGDIANQAGTSLASDALTLGKNAGIAGIVNKFKSGATNTTALLAEERLALNPKKEVMFNSFGYRQHTFRFSFAPKSQEESDMVGEIIQTLRYYSLPEISESKLFYILPSEFEVSFMLGKVDNPAIPRIATSVLRSVISNYSPAGIWATLPNGAPVAIEMQLDFLELEIIDRKRVYNADSAITSGY